MNMDWANVNPKVPHPRWSQETERLLGSNKNMATQIFNGYGPQVSGLYDGMFTGDARKLFFKYRGINCHDWLMKSA